MKLPKLRKKPAPKAPDVSESVVPAEVAFEAPRFNAEGVLLNPEKFNVSADGMLTRKGAR